MQDRRHDIDALRVFAFALLIAYHVGMVYVQDWGFHIKSPQQWDWLQWPMVAINRWRMPLIFLLSGIALGLSRGATRPGRLALRRTRFLLIPLIFGMLAIVPVQAWVEARLNGAFDGGFVSFLLRYWQLRPWPRGSFAGAEFGVTWNHLWYLAYLWFYSMALAAGILLSRWIGFTGATRLSIVRAPGHAAAAALTVVPAAWLCACLYWLEPLFGDTKALTDDWAQHAQYFPVLLFGFWLARAPVWWTRVVELRRWTLALALLGLTIYMRLRVAGQVLTPVEVDALPAWNWRAISDGAHALYAWNMLLAILGYGAIWLNRPFRWLPYANRAVYPWYILHQSLIVPLAFFLIPLALPGPLEATLLLTGTLLGCALIHHGIILRTPMLWPLFGVYAAPVQATGPTPSEPESAG
ncbi:MAG TPA: acyltransferase family protein [Wenzhouxiangellaceae bacterium]|nr:acyltransferase family protein [Wenzhouxiangellaceae bacterium]